ncbi:MAG: guanylate kinase [Chitinophagaceae bacterium]|nr:guanylate kinase [Chitinophagaceae bacterium]
MKDQKIIIITAPSGSGKSTLTKLLMAAFPQLAFSISACTRSPRAGETDGVDYHFISVPAFEKAIAAREFIEWEMVYEGKYYGTLKTELNRIWDRRQVPLVDIDVKGALNVQQQYPGHHLSVFIQAPSLSILKERLEKRGTETAETLAERIGKAEYELSFAQEFDHIVVNDDLARASEQLIGIVGDYLNN